MREGGDLSKGDLSWHAGEEGRRGPLRSPVHRKTEQGCVVVTGDKGCS